MRGILLAALLLISCSSVFDFISPSVKKCVSDSDCGDELCIEDYGEKICGEKIAVAKHRNEIERTCKHDSWTTHTMQGYVTDYCTRVEVRRYCKKCGHSETLSSKNQGICPP